MGSATLYGSCTNGADAMKMDVSWHDACSSVLFPLSIKKGFFFQAEDGIRDELVTGVQTCALPISGPARSWRRRTPERRGPCRSPARDWGRSEERRVGKSVDLGGRRIIQKKRG